MMLRFVGYGSLGVWLALTSPTMVNGQNVLPSDPTGVIAEGTPQEYAQLRKLQSVVGKLNRLDSKNVVLEIQYQYPVAQTPQQMQQFMMQMQQQMNRRPTHSGKMCCCGGMMGYMPSQWSSKVTLATGIKTFELDFTDNLIVRRAKHPYQTKPGDIARFGDLRPGQFVRIYLAKPKPTPTADKKRRDNITGSSVARPQVSIIQFLADSNETLAPIVKD